MLDTMDIEQWRNLRGGGGGGGGKAEPLFLAKSKIDWYTIALVVSKGLVFMEPSLPSSYKMTLALAHIRVILNEY